MTFNFNIWILLEITAIFFAVVGMFGLLGVKDPVERAQIRTTVTYEVAVAIYASIKGKDFDERRQKVYNK